MQLPNAAEAFIEDRKIARYLLHEAHLAGRGKAVGFHAFGYTVESLHTDLLALAQTDNAQVEPLSEFGPRWSIRGTQNSERTAPHRQICVADRLRQRSTAPAYRISNREATTMKPGINGCRSPHPPDQ
jgi:hypothetical protein